MYICSKYFLRFKDNYIFSIGDQRIIKFTMQFVKIYRHGEYLSRVITLWLIQYQ